jgi:hypothetical protein
MTNLGTRHLHVLAMVRRKQIRIPLPGVRMYSNMHVYAHGLACLDESPLDGRQRGTGFNTDLNINRCRRPLLKWKVINQCFRKDIIRKASARNETARHARQPTIGGAVLYAYVHARKDI